MAEKGDKFPLLIYQRWAKMLRPWSLLIAIISGVLWWFSPAIEKLASLGWLFLVLAVAGILIYLYSLLARRAAYVQCLPNYVKIRTPLLSVAVSYRRILQVRPVEFHSQLTSADVSRTKRRLIRPFVARTVILLELTEFPTNEGRLRLWLPWFLFASEVTGFVLVVEDWMTLSRQISVFSDRWVTRRQERQRQRGGLFR